VDQWAAALAFLLLSAVVGASMILGAKLLGVRGKRRTELTEKTYECGEEPEGPAWIKFHPRYYVVALVFVLFDVEAVFLFPWALNIEGLGALAIAEMFVFISILMLGWVYALKKGALKWQ
jgi:NADH:ubiquinone oxidoreductase subunit 3 (subunit A)